MKENFVKINSMIININSVDAIYPNEGRGMSGYTMLISGQMIKISDQEAQKIISIIEFDPDRRIDAGFDPDKRIPHFDPDTPIDQNAITAEEINKIRQAVNEYNNHAYSKFNMSVATPIIKITKENADGCMMINIITGVVEEDTIPNYSIRDDIYKIIMKK